MAFSHYFIAMSRMLISQVAVHRVVRSIQTSTCSASGHHNEHWWGPERAAGRQLVGYGSNGDNTYQDRLDYWYPAIRFRKEDGMITPIRQKEQADWKKLTTEEKKLLYRYSYKQTLSEFEAPTGYWKMMFSVVFMLLSVATGYHIFITKFVYPELPPTFQDEYKEAQVRRMIALEKGSFLGPAKYWDYENKKWK